MRKARFLLAVAAISGLALMGTSSSASPLTSGLASGSATVPPLKGDFLQNVQIWSCREKRSDMTVQQRHFCDGYYDYYDYGYGYGYPRYGYGYRRYGYGYPGYGLGVVPFLSFGFGGGRHHRHGGWDD
jgi:hypothetical protein